MRRLEWATVSLIVATALMLAGCDDDTDAAPARGPVTMSMVRSATLPPPPFRGSPTLIANRDRLLALAPLEYLDFRAKRMVAEFDFHSWRWHRLPGFRGVRPIPVAHGLVSVDRKCTVEPCPDSEGQVGFVFVETRADDATLWTVRRIGDKPRDLDSSGIGVPPIGNIGDTAFWGHGELISGSLSGEYRHLVRGDEPLGLVCMVGRRLLLLEDNSGAVVDSGRVFTLDLEHHPLAWTQVPGSSMLKAAPGGGAWIHACGRTGPMFATRDRLYRFVRSRWLSVPMVSTPDVPLTYQATVTPSGDLIFTAGNAVHRLHRGSWTSTSVGSPPSVTIDPLSSIPLAVVGDVPVVALFNHATRRSILRVVR